LNEIRLQGANQEIIDQIVHLSIRYGIITPYTSYLVTEQAPLGEAEQQRLADETYGKLLAQPTAAPSGQLAVQSAANAGAMQGAGNAPTLEGEASTTVRIMGSRTFVLSDGKWIDTGYDPDTMQTTKIEFLSPEYFTLVAAHPELADAFALGEQVVALSNGVVYEVIPGEVISQSVKPTPTPIIPSRPTPTTDSPELPTQTPTQESASKPSGLCGAVLIPLLLMPLLVTTLTKKKRII
jgi:Ca-activated chloride channel family protein